MHTTTAPSSTPVSAAFAPRLHSGSGAQSLIEQACKRFTSQQLQKYLSPLFPEACPWDEVAQVPLPKSKTKALRMQETLSSVSALVEQYRRGLTQSAGEMAPWLDASEEDIKSMALKFAKLDLSADSSIDDLQARQSLLSLPSVIEFPGMAKFLSLPVLPTSAFDKKLLWAETLLQMRIPGDSRTAQHSRLNDPKFWRRMLRVILMREREHFFLRLRLMGHKGEAYVSDQQLTNRQRQLRAQASWMADTVIVPSHVDSEKKLKRLPTLAEVASSPATRFAKLYTFVNAMEAIAVEQQLHTGMLTLTLEPEWHPNPSHGTNSWEGASPREAHQSLGKRWQAVLRDLDRLGVGVSGLRVVEPHKDACPHWHIWLLYRPEAERQILQVIMRYFPNKLKVRACGAKGHRIYDSLEHLKSGSGRAPTHAKEGAQVELARIDRKISSGASYAMKYLFKTVKAGTELERAAGLLPAEDVVLPNKAQQALDAKRAKQEATAERVDAFRSLWGINAAQLFGVAKCLTAWDELRLLGIAPSSPQLHKLWVLARGGVRKGRIPRGAGIRGDAKGFIEALGGLAACGKAPPDKERISIGRLTTPGLNSYGECITRNKGVTLVERTREKVIVTRVDKDTGEVKKVRCWRSYKTVRATVITRHKHWTMVPAKQAQAALKRLYERMG